LIAGLSPIVPKGAIRDRPTALMIVKSSIGACYSEEQFYPVPNCSSVVLEEVGMKNRECMCLVIIILMAFSLRIYAIDKVEYKMEWDTLNYHNMAKNFIENGFLGYGINEVATKPNAYITLGYPLFLSFIYSVTDGGNEYGIFTVKMVQALLGTVTVMFIFFIAKKIGGLIAGIISAVFAAVYPAFLVVTAYHLTETLYNFVFCMYLYLQLIAFEKDKKIIHLISGFTFGIVVMVRPTIFPLFAAIYFVEFLLKRKREYISCFLYFVIGLLIIMIPWWIRNYLVTGEFVLLCTQAGNPLIGGAYPPGFSGDMHVGGNQLEEGIKIIINGFINYPYEYIKWFTIGKLKIIFGKVYLAGFLPELKIFCIVHYASLFLGFVGAICSILKNNVRILAEYVIMLTVLQLAFIPEQRYAFSIMSVLMILSGYAVSRIKLVRKKQ